MIKEDIQSAGMLKSAQARTSLRIAYESEARVIRERIGSLTDIQNRLELPARKICQLLMVDPSAWNRWTRGKTPVPPHIYRSLEWYLLLKEKHPGLSVQQFLPLNSRFNFQSKALPKFEEDFSAEIQGISNKNTGFNIENRLLLSLMVSQTLTLIFLAGILIFR